MIAPTCPGPGKVRGVSIHHAATAHSTISAAKDARVIALDVSFDCINAHLAPTLRPLARMVNAGCRRRDFGPMSRQVTCS